MPDFEVVMLRLDLIDDALSLRHPFDALCFRDDEDVTLEMIKSRGQEFDIAIIRNIGVFPIKQSQKEVMRYREKLWEVVVQALIRLGYPPPNRFDNRPPIKKKLDDTFAPFLALAALPLLFVASLMASVIARPHFFSAAQAALYAIIVFITFRFAVKLRLESAMQTTSTAAIPLLTWSLIQELSERSVITNIVLPSAQDFIPYAICFLSMIGAVFVSRLPIHAGKSSEFNAEESFSNLSKMQASAFEPIGTATKNNLAGKGLVLVTLALIAVLITFESRGATEVVQSEIESLASVTREQAKQSTLEALRPTAQARETNLQHETQAELDAKENDIQEVKAEVIERSKDLDAANEKIKSLARNIGD